MVRSAAAFAVAFFAVSLPGAVFAAPLRAGDHIAVTVFNHPELTLGSATIDGEGKLAMPLVGNVAISGYEPDVAAARIGDSLKSYLRTPVVSLSVLQQNQTIAITGGLTSTIAYAPGETLSSIVSPLTGNTSLDLHHVSIERDNASLGTFDALDLLRHAQAGPLMQPNDQVMVALNPVGVNVLGVVPKTGMTYLETGSTIADAVNAAGGAPSNAATGAIDLLRNGVHQHLALSTDAMTTVAKDGDVVTVPQAVHVAVAGLVGRPGETALTFGNTLIAAIYQAGGPVRYSDVSHTQVMHDGVVKVYDITKVPQGDVSQNPHLSEGDIVTVPTGGHLNLSDIFGAAGIIHWFF
jgi:protein involved in polysaccharide export with SLBB domain